MVLIGTEFVLGVENVTFHEISAQLFVSTSVPEFEIKTGTDRYRICLRCKHESCRQKCYLYNGFGLTSKSFLELKLSSNY